MTIRVSNSKHERLKKLAEKQGLSLNKLFEEWSNVALAQWDAEARFIARATRGNAERGLKILDKIDRGFRSEKKKS